MKRSVKDALKKVSYTMLGEGEFNPALLCAVAIFFGGCAVLAWRVSFDFGALLLFSFTSLGPLWFNWLFASFLRSLLAQAILILSSLLYLSWFWHLCWQYDAGFVLLGAGMVFLPILLVLGLAAALMEWITNMIRKR